MFEINIKVNGNGTLNIGNTDRIKLGTENEVNRVKLVFETTMDHSQTSMKKAQEDVVRVLTDYLKNRKLNILNFFDGTTPQIICTAQLDDRGR